MSKKSIILGAGFTGLAAGIKTGWPIYEMKEKAGGICLSYWKNGFEFEDGGGHWIFGKGEGLNYMKSLVPMNFYERQAGVYYNKIFPYPFQTIAQQEINCNEGSMKHWLWNKFGGAQCNLFFNPFNEKYTAGLYDYIIQDEEYKSPPAGSLGFVSTFHDPVDGLSSLVDKMAAKCKIWYNHKVFSINVDTKELLFENGMKIEWDKIISTLPLNNLLTMCGKHDFDLPFTSVLVLNIGAEKGIACPTQHWLYIPFCKNGFYRVGFYSNIDQNKAPRGKVGIWVEIPIRDFDYNDLDVDVIIQEIVAELQSWNWIGNIITTDPTWVKTAYTWLKSKEDRDKQLVWLKEHDIISTGRYGAWKFGGMVQSIEMGFAAANKIIDEEMISKEKDK